jgi:hypothetical protein
MRNLWIIGAMAFDVACSGEEGEEGDLCTNLPVEVTVVNSAGEPVPTATVEMDNVACAGDGTTNVYQCTAVQNDTGMYQLTVLEPNSNAFSQFLVLPPPEEWCDAPPFAFDVELGVMMGS